MAKKFKVDWRLRKADGSTARLKEFYGLPTLKQLKRMGFVEIQRFESFDWESLTDMLERWFEIARDLRRRVGSAN